MYLLDMYKYIHIPIAHFSIGFLVLFLLVSRSS